MLRIVFALACLALAPANGAASAAEDHFDANGVNLHYITLGTGEPVVLIHGLYSSEKLNWELPGIVKRLATRYQVIALDMPGHGLSDKPDLADAYGLAMVDDVVRLLDHLKIKKAHVVGYSMGGMIVMKLLSTHPDRAASAVVGGMGWMREGSFLADFWERIQGGGRGQTPAVCAQNLGKLALSAEELKAIRVPTLVIVGERDPVRQLYVEPLKQARPDIRVVEVPDAGHVDTVMSLEFKDAIEKWLRQAPGFERPEVRRVRQVRWVRRVPGTCIPAIVPS
jgi:pimeloyl-ACP methyl ester carboxylesterase